jgi:hypothetical protein
MSLFTGGFTAEGLGTLASSQEEHYSLRVQEMRRAYPPELVEGWRVADEFLEVELPAVTVLAAHRQNVRGVVFPYKDRGLFGDKTIWPIRLRLYDLYRMLPNRVPQQLPAYWVAHNFHHFAADRVPGFWSAYYWAEAHKKEFRLKLRFKDQAVITFHGFGGARGLPNGAPAFYISHKDGRVQGLIYRALANDPLGEDCYPEHLSSGRRFPCWLAPNAQTRSAIVEAFAMLAALP